MEVAPPLNTTNIHFTSSPYTNTPPSPPPTTGDHSFSSHDFDHRSHNSPATVPFAWEESPGVPKSTTSSFPEEPIEFAFDVSSEFPLNSPLTADDLFHGGMIKPYAAVKDNNNNNSNNNYNNNMTQRGRETNSLNPSSSRNRRTRSLPPYRVVEPPPAPETTAAPSSGSSCTTLLASGSGKGSKKWSFKDLFLFRSASDGRILDKDPLKKYSGVFRKHDEDLRNSSLRDRSGSGSGSVSKRRGPVSAHELHYTVNRAVSNDMKKKTFLPYKQGILGRLAFNPAVHALSNGFGFSHRNYN